MNLRPNRSGDRLIDRTRTLRGREMGPALTEVAPEAIAGVRVTQSRYTATTLRVHNMLENLTARSRPYSPDHAQSTISPGGLGVPWPR